jgi:hypothetical protein
MSPSARQLQRQRRSPIAKAPAGHRSPNLADAVKILFARVPPGIQIVGVFG